MRKTLLVIASLSLALSSAACGSSSDSTSSEPNTAVASADTSDHYISTTAYAGFTTEAFINGDRITFISSNLEKGNGKTDWVGILPTEDPSGTVTAVKDPDAEFTDEQTESIELTFDGDTLKYTEIPTQPDMVRELVSLSSLQDTDPDVDYFGKGMSLTSDTLTTRESRIKITEVKKIPADTDRPGTVTVGVFYDTTNLSDRSSVDQYLELISVQQKLADGTVKDAEYGNNQEYAELASATGMLEKDQTESTISMYTVDEDATELILAARSGELTPILGEMTFPLS